MGIGLTIKMIGGKKLLQALNSSKTITKPLDNGIRRITFHYEGLVKKATPVDTGRLRSSINSQFSGARASVGTNVQYAQFVEYGTSKMEARHMEGSSKVFGVGMFSYAWGKLKDWLGKGKHDIQIDIDKEFSKRFRP
tara:strand:+ start:5723 stop:6133 length:411 start_codon:yes stop_codon:yes gene_type:complete